MWASPPTYLDEDVHHEVTEAACWLAEVAAQEADCPLAVVAVNPQVNGVTDYLPEFRDPLAGSEQVPVVHRQHIFDVGVVRDAQGCGDAVGGAGLLEHMA